jgi:hypothetical protein
VLLHRIHRVAALALLALLALLLSGCGLSGAATAPTAIPAATPAAGAPTSAPIATPSAGAQPTTVAVATPADAQPVATKPTFTFEPRAGGPGTTISLRGWGFAPNTSVKIGVGFPAYTGGPLGATNANARGEWQTQVTLPNTQPSPGPEWGKMLLIALDGGDKALASAPFAYIVDAQPAPQDPHPAVNTISALLDTWASADVRPLLAQNLIGELDAGRPLHQILGLAPQGKPSYSIANPVPMSGNPNTVYVDATLGYAGYTDVRQFAVVLEGGAWKVAASQLVSTTQQPANPIIGFNPKGGGPGTSVSAFGSGYAPGKHVAIRLGVPHPIGEVLASALVGADGRWSVSFVLPERLPSGERIPDGQIYLVAMGERNEALASAPFRFQGPADPPTPAPPASPAEAVERFLTAVQADRSGRTALPYAGGRLREAIERQAIDLGGVLHEQNPFSGFRVDGEIAQATPFVYVRATLLYGSDASGGAARIFTLSRGEGTWRVFEVSLDAQSPPAPPAEGDDGWQVAMSGDFNGDGMAETLRYRASGLAMQDGFGDPSLDSNAIAVSAVEVLQDGAHGRWAWLQVNGGGVWSGGQQIARIASDARPQGAAAFRLALGSGSGPLFYVLPLDENGRAFTQAMAIGWDPAAHQYRLL